MYKNKVNKQNSAFLHTSDIKKKLKEELKTNSNNNNKLKPDKKTFHTTSSGEWKAKYVRASATDHEGKQEMYVLYVCVCVRVYLLGMRETIYYLISEATKRNNNKRLG